LPEKFSLTNLSYPAAAYRNGLCPWLFQKYARIITLAIAA
jgi:hypothetical protein